MGSIHELRGGKAHRRVGPWGATDNYTIAPAAHGQAGENV
jgi:hypothetical protein